MTLNARIMPTARILDHVLSMNPEYEKVTAKMVKDFFPLMNVTDELIMELHKIQELIEKYKPEKKHICERDSIQCFENEPGILRLMIKENVRNWIPHGVVNFCPICGKSAEGLKMSGNDTYDKYGKPYELDDSKEDLYEKLQEAREEIEILKEKLEELTTGDHE